MKKIKLTHNKYVLIDNEDFDLCNSYRWFYMNNKLAGYGYASFTKTIKGKRKVIRMHNIIMRPPQGYEVDHINRDTLDNRRTNLRICTRGENMANRGVFKNNKLGLKNIRRRNGKYQVRVQREGVPICLGTFSKLSEAIRTATSSASVTDLRVSALFVNNK